jgi:hypothetical protein
MSQPDDAPLSPDPPRPPGAPSAEDLDVEIPDVTREVPDSQDVREDAGEVEPPD